MLRRAQRTAAGSMSTACTSAWSTVAARAAPIAPAPQHRSRIISPGWASATACWTRNSVRRRGTKTPGSTAMRRPKNSAQPRTCSSGRPAARRSTIASSSSGLRAVAMSNRPRSTAKTQPAAPAGATIGGSATLPATVAKVDDPGAERPGLEQFELDRALQRGEVRRTAAQHDRNDEQPVLVDEVQLDQRGGQARAAHRYHALPRRFPEPGHLGGHVVGGQPGVALDLLERGGEHDLRDGFPDPGELQQVRAGHGRLGGLPDQHVLVQPPPHQFHADPGGLLDVERKQLLVGIGPGNVAAGARNEAVQRHAHGVDHRAHHGLPVVRMDPCLYGYARPCRATARAWPAYGSPPEPITPTSIQRTSSFPRPTAWPRPSTPISR